MDGLIALVFMVLGFALIGLIWTCAFVIRLLIGSERPPAPPPTPARAAPPPNPNHSRPDLLRQFRAEVKAAYQQQKISSRAHTDFLQYVEDELEAVRPSPPRPRNFETRNPPIVEKKERSTSPPTPVPPSPPLPPTLEAILSTRSAPLPMAEVSATEIPRTELPSTETAPTVPPTVENPVTDPLVLQPVPVASIEPPRKELPSEMKPSAKSPQATPLIFSPHAEPKKPWLERLMTPENVRIIQSLGISITFISAVAFVRTQWWDTGSAAWRMGLLMMLTLACSGLGLALARWTSLRIAALGFLILGQLSIILDTYAALIPTVGGGSIYPFSPESLWPVGFVIFTAAAIAQARALKEPLFNAFTLFGTVGAWISGAIWLAIEPANIPAACVPLALGLGGLSAWNERRTQSRGPLQRWSLTWWAQKAWRMGGLCLVGVLPVAALWSAENGVPNVTVHLTAFAVLGTALIWDGLRRSSVWPIHAGVALLLSMAPLAAHLLEWPRNQWPATLALPAAAMFLAGMAISRWKRATPAIASVVKSWGLGINSVGALWGLVVCAREGTPALALAALSSTAVVQLALAVWERRAWAAWTALAATVCAVSFGFDRCNLDFAWQPSVWLALAGAFCAAGRLAKRRGVDEAGAAVVAHAGFAADVLAFCAVATAAWLAPWRADAIGTNSATLCAAVAWAMAGAYGWLSRWRGDAMLRGSTAVAALSPAIAMGLYFAGASFAAPAPILAAIAMAFGIMAWIRPTTGASPLGSMMAGGVGLMLHGLVLALWQMAQGMNDSAMVSFAMLGAASIASLPHWRRVGGDGAASAVQLVVWSAVSMVLGNVWVQTDFGPLGWTLAFEASALILIALNAAVEICARRFGWRMSARGAYNPMGDALALLHVALAAGWLISRSPIMAPTALSLHALTAGAALALIAHLRAARKEPTLGMEATSAVGAMIAGLMALLGSAWSVPIAIQFAPALGFRTASAVFFSVLFLGSAAVHVMARRGWSVKDDWTPFTALFATAGLAISAHSAFLWPVESRGLVLAVLALGGSWVTGALGRSRGGAFDTARVAALHSLAAGAAVIQLTHLLAWTSGSAHGYGVAGWCVLGVYVWPRRDGLAKVTPAVCAAVCVPLAGCHALLASGIENAWLSSILAGATLVLLAIHTLLDRVVLDAEKGVAELDRRAKPVLAVAVLSMLAALSLAGIGVFGGRLWSGALTFALGSVAVGWMSLNVRRRGAPLAAERALTLEAVTWSLLSCAVIVAVRKLQWDFGGLGCAMLGAVSLLIGMALEALVGALLPTERAKETPSPFLESRFGASVVLGLVGILFAMLSGPAAQVHGVWRALFGAALLALNGSIARWSGSAIATRECQRISSLAGYVVLLPAAYLAFLKAHSTGSSWGAVWVLGLAPVLFAANWALKRAAFTMQAEFAKWAGWGISLLAVPLAFTSNIERIAWVPCVVFAALAVEATVAWRRRQRVEAAFAACVAVGLAMFFAIRGCVGVPAWGTVPWLWEMPILGAIVLMAGEIGARFKWMARRDGSQANAVERSIVFDCAAFGVAVCAAVAGGEWLHYHAAIGFPSGRRDAFALTLCFAAALALRGKRWREWTNAPAVAGVLTLGAYFLCVWRVPVRDLEWFTLPAAGLAFAFAKDLLDRAIPEGGEARREKAVTWLLALASALAVGPSLILALPWEDSALRHFALLAIESTALIGGALLARRKIPLLAGSASLILALLVKAFQWAELGRALGPATGVAVGLLVVALSTLLEARMNKAVRDAVKRARAEAEMFWLSWK